MTIQAGEQARSNTIRLDELAPYEFAEILGGGPKTPNSIVTITRPTLERIDELAAAAFEMSVDRLETILGPLAQISLAVNQRRPFDRIVPLWSALALAAQMGGDLTVAKQFISGRAAVRSEKDRSDAWRALFLGRHIVRRDPWFKDHVRASLTGRARSVDQQMRMATVFAYAFRSAIAHGHWSAVPQRRVHALYCEKWLWTLLERALEHRLVGTRLRATSPRAQAAVSG